jgi:hypothetical protein
LFIQHNDTMSEHWKSTPKYWCKHCATYIRDTKLERQNHEATAKHQSALKRFLRDLHRGHEQGERDKERAKQEVARLNGVLSGSSSSAAPATSGVRTAPTASSRPAAHTEAQLKKQRDQLAEMGISVPDAMRPEMAIPGEWTVTTTRVIDDGEKATKEEDEDTKAETKATGVRKRELSEEKQDEEDALKGLFKKPRRWGRDSRAMPTNDDLELDALLSMPLAAVKQADAAVAVKSEAAEGEKLAGGEEVKQEEVKAEDGAVIKPEPEDESKVSADQLGVPAAADATIKEEEASSSAPSVVFKKRKPKTMRQK